MLLYFIQCISSYGSVLYLCESKGSQRPWLLFNLTLLGQAPEKRLKGFNLETYWSSQKADPHSKNLWSGGSFPWAVNRQEELHISRQDNFRHHTERQWPQLNKGTRKPSPNDEDGAVLPHLPISLHSLLSAALWSFKSITWVLKNFSFEKVKKGRRRKQNQKLSFSISLVKVSFAKHGT